MAHPNIDLDALSTEDQLELLDRLWERLGRDPDLYPLTDHQKAELDRRSADLDRDLAAGRPAGIPWEDVLERIQGR